MGHTFGVFSNNQKGVTFGDMRASLVEGISNPNHPDNPESPNAPRAVGRIEGYPNPLLGDDGRGKIGRWQQVSLDAVEIMIEQMIEQYLRDKSWYSTVRCREALWNMYRRMEWWVQNETDPMRSDYQRVLQLLRDCIYKILQDAQQPGGVHEGVDLPVCPAPYPFNYHGDYFNHYDGNTVEVKLFSMMDLGVSDSFPGFFRYVSSTEDQEWQIVHSVGTNEMSGSENIMKLDITRLKYSNSSKITFKWRFKHHGYIRFKVLASVAKGNGLAFFINGEQVSGEWSQQTDWLTVKFNVSPGQTFKFDWLARRQSEESFGYNAIYLKDVECFETIYSLESPTPPDFDTLGSDAYSVEGFDWITHSHSSVVRTDFNGVVVEGEHGNTTRTLIIPVDGECDGTVTFAYRTGVRTPSPEYEWNLILQDDLTRSSQEGHAKHGSSTTATYDSNWTFDPGRAAVTDADSAKITYEVIVGDNCWVDVKGSLMVECPKRVIDHYEPYIVTDMEHAYWYTSGNIHWQILGTTTDKNLRVDNPTQGSGSASTTVNLADDGWFTFSFDQKLRATETFEVHVDGKKVWEAHNTASGTNIMIPLTKGSHRIEFFVVDTYTEQPYYFETKKDFSYGNATRGQTFRTTGQYGSSVDITRNMLMSNAGATAVVTGDNITYKITLNPGASIDLKEEMLFAPPAGVGGMVFHETFNTRNGIGTDPSLEFSYGWYWVDLVMRDHPDWDDGRTVQDGVMAVTNMIGQYTVTKRNVTVYGGASVSWEYGGKFGYNDKFEFYCDDVLLWSDVHSTSGEDGIYVTVSIPPGTHTLKWVYKSNGGIAVPVQNDNGGGTPTGTTPDPYGEMCFSQGSARYPVLYPASEVGVTHTTDRTSRYSWSGEGFYTSDTLHAQERDQEYITRYWYTPSFSTMDYRETLTLHQGIRENDVWNLKPVKYSMSMIGGNFYQGAEYFGMDVKHLLPDTQAGYSSSPFYTDGEVEITFDLLAYLRDGDSRSFKSGNSSGRYSDSRAQLDIYLVPVNRVGGFHSEDRKLSITDNAGTNYRQNYALGAVDWSGAQKIRIHESVPAGKYILWFVISDTCPDNDFDYQGILYYAAVRNLNISVTDSTRDTSGEFDNTSVTVELWNDTDGILISKNTYGMSPYAVNGVSTYSIYYTTPQPGKVYKVKYTLNRGDGTKGGLYGTGGTFTLSGGQYTEYWGAYCRDNNNNYYPKGQSPNPSTNTTTTNYSVVPFVPCECWIDDIKIYSGGRDVCPGTILEVDVHDDDTGYLLSRNQYIGVGNNHQTIDVPITNTTDTVKHYTITYMFTQGCSGDTVTLYNGSLTIKDALPPAPSYVTVTDFVVTDNKPIWMGGCDGSSMTVKVYDQLNNVVFNQTYTSELISTFSVTNLQHLPYSKYRVEVTTDQKGIISAVTGKKYYTKFKLLDFKSFENFHNVADPYNAKLEFFIDGQLIDTYTTPGGFNTVSYPLPKGSHELKWVFTEYGRGYSWDFAEIDFLKLTNWICDTVMVVPYCEPGSGDKCVEALIKCLIDLWQKRPKACVIGKKIWLFT